MCHITKKNAFAIIPYVKIIGRLDTYLYKTYKIIFVQFLYLYILKNIVYLIILDSNNILLNSDHIRQEVLTISD